MTVTLMVPRYKIPSFSDDERIAKAIVNPMDPAHGMPRKCGDCGTAGSFKNPLMARPVFLMDHGGPKGELYEGRCSECMERKARRR